MNKIPLIIFLAVLCFTVFSGCSFVDGFLGGADNTDDNNNTNTNNNNRCKIQRNTAGVCIRMPIDAWEGQYPERIGTYQTQQQADNALAQFKTQPRPDREGFKVCETAN